MPFKNKEERREYQRRWLAARREAWLLENGPCFECGSSEGLQVDHKDPSTKIDHKVWSWSEKRRTEELTKCQVLCKKHHEAKTAIENSRPIPHGTDAGYTARKCRCSLCSTAHREKRQLDKILYGC